MDLLLKFLISEFCFKIWHKIWFHSKKQFHGQFRSTFYIIQIGLVMISR